jgi:putative ABC transport system permease protein
MKRDPRRWFWAPPVEQEVDEELAFHLEMHTRDLIAKGLAPDAAREAAQERLGDLHRLRRTCVSLGRKRNRIMRITQWLDDFRSDLLVAIRRLKQSPGFTAVAVVTLALGIGANSAIFALADATLLRPLQFPDADRLVMLHERTPTIDRTVVAPFETVEWISRNKTFEAMAGVFGGKRAMTGADGIGEQIDTQMVSSRFFDVFRVAPIAGRTFLPADDRPDGAVVVLSERLWKGRFAGDPALIGSQVTIDGNPFTVVGVMPETFQVLARSDAWIIMTTSFMRGPAGFAHFLRVVGRRATGVSLVQARADMTSVADAIARERPDLNKDRGVLLEPLHDGLIGSDLRLMARVLFGVVAFVLLTCCANVANLVLARTSTRARELAVRSALGAGGRRIARLLFTESLVLASLSAVLGIALGWAILGAAPSLMPPRVLPVDVRLTFDVRVLVFCASAAFALAVAFSAAPAWQAARLPPAQAMAAGGRTATGSGSSVRTVLALSQIAAAVVLLCGAGLLLRSLVALAGVDSGSRAREVLTMTLGLPFVRPNAPPGTPYLSAESRLRYYEAVEREVRSVAGVHDVALGSAMPFAGWWIGMNFQLEGAAPRPEALRDASRYLHVGPSYFRVLGIPVIAGRVFTGNDTAAAIPVCIVNDAFARQFLRGRAAVGTRIVVRGMNTGIGPLPVREIVGVVSNVKERPDEPEPEPQLYVPVAQDTPSQLSLAIEPEGGSSAALAPAIRAAIARVDRERPVQDMRTIAGIRYDATAPARFRTVVIGAFAVLALTLAVIGVFGVLAYSVQRRLREFGVRIALGATTRDVLAIVFGDTARLFSAGLVLGLLGAAAIGRSMSALLFGIRPADPLTFVGVAAVLALTAAAATMLPALRAARVDPVVALRDE